MAAFALASLAGARVAEARDVYLNGIKLDASVVMQPQTFTGCDVRIDEKGDVHITAKGYKVVPREGASAPASEPRARQAVPPTGRPARQVWLISRQARKGAAQYDVDVFVNDQFVAKVRAADDPVVLDVTRFVGAGANRARMIATKRLESGRLSHSPTDTIEVLLGEGAQSGGTVTVSRVLASFKRDASETTSIREDFSFTLDGPGSLGN